jgi:hypothetical protein
VVAAEIFQASSQEPALAIPIAIKRQHTGFVTCFGNPG